MERLARLATVSAALREASLAKEAGLMSAAKFALGHKKLTAGAIGAGGAAVSAPGAFRHAKAGFNEALQAPVPGV